MTTEEFITFQRYNDREQAFELGTILKENNIAYLIEESPARFNPSFVGNNLEKEFTVKIKKEDFINAEQIQEKIILKQLEHVDSDYYLYQFTDKELMEILTNRYQWSQFDFLLAQKLLKERGKEVNPQVVELLKEQKLEEMSKHETGESHWILAGYISALLGGLIGIVIGIHLFIHKKTLPNGEVMYAYSEADRKHGVIIILLSILSLLTYGAIKFLGLF